MLGVAEEQWGALESGRWGPLRTSRRSRNWGRETAMLSEDCGMPEANTPTLRIHRATTRRRTLRELNCPLEPELLVPEFATELPPEVAAAVPDHIATCEPSA